MSTSANVIEYSADQYCDRCRSIFSQPDSFYRLADSEEGLAHHELDDLVRSYQEGCPFCAFLVDSDRQIDMMREQGVRNLVLDIASMAFSGVPRDYEPGHVDFLRLYHRLGNGRLKGAGFVGLSAPIGNDVQLSDGPS